MMFGGIIFFIFIIYLLNNNNDNFQFQSHSYNALDELKQKFVNGDIDEEEYLRKKNLLEK